MHVALAVKLQSIITTTGQGRPPSQLTIAQHCRKIAPAEYVGLCIVSLAPWLASCFAREAAGCYSGRLILLCLSHSTAAHAAPGPHLEAWLSAPTAHPRILNGLDVYMI